MAVIDLEQLLEIPNLPQLIERANQALRDESRRRNDFYAWLKEDVKAEFINGEIIMHSPVKERHWAAVGNIYGLLKAYAIKHKLGRVASEKALIALLRNDYEPDVCFWKAEKADLFTANQMKFPAPNLVVEVLSKNTAKRDRDVKFADYAANGIGEYWIVNPGKQTVEQYTLDPELEEYEAAATLSDAAEIASKQVAGFRVSILSFFDEQANMNALTSLLST